MRLQFGHSARERACGPSFLFVDVLHTLFTYKTTLLEAVEAVGGRVVSDGLFGSGGSTVSVAGSGLLEMLKGCPTVVDPRGSFCAPTSVDNKTHAVYFIRNISPFIANI